MLKEAKQAPFVGRFVPEWDKVMGDIKVNEEYKLNIEPKIVFSDEQIKNIESFREKLNERHNNIQKRIDVEAREELELMVSILKYKEEKEMIRNKKLIAFNNLPEKNENKKTVFDYLNEEIDLKQVALDTVQVIKNGWNNFWSLFVSDEKLMIGSEVSNIKGIKDEKTRKYIYQQRINGIKNKRENKPMFAFAKNIGLIKL